MLCAYEFESERHGHLDLAPALHNSLSPASEATLTSADGREHKIRIVLGQAPSAAAFEVTGDLQAG